MPNIDLCFSGWIRNAEVEYVYVVATGIQIDISEVSAETLIDNLENGTWAISLTECLDRCSKSKVEMFDYDSNEVTQ